MTRLGFPFRCLSLDRRDSDGRIENSKKKSFSRAQFVGSLQEVIRVLTLNHHIFSNGNEFMTPDCSWMGCESEADGCGSS